MNYLEECLEFFLLQGCFGFEGNLTDAQTNKMHGSTLKVESV
jgi:hypothetical protein